MRLKLIDARRNFLKWAAIRCRSLVFNPLTISLAQHLAMELSEHGIRVNAVSPAVVETPIYGAFIKPEEIGKTLAGFNAFRPIGRRTPPLPLSR